MTVVPFTREHLDRISLQPAQSFCSALLTPEMVERVAELEGYTALVAGEPVAICGVLEREPGVFAAWSLISGRAGRHLLAITREIDRFLRSGRYPVLEAFVDVDFDAGHRWMAALDFQPEGEPVLMAGRLQTRYLRTVTYG